MDITNGGLINVNILSFTEMCKLIAMAVREKMITLISVAEISNDGYADRLNI
jgi:hypothetical protein